MILRNEKQRIEGRIEWALHHIQQVQELLELHRKDHPFEVEAKRDLNTGYYSFRLASVKPFPPELGFHVGDAINNLRASMDNTIWALRLPGITDERLLKGISFFCSDVDPVKGAHDWSSWQGRVGNVLPAGILHDLHNLQPYQGANPERTAFATLDALWQWSKHRLPLFGVGLEPAPIRWIDFFEGDMDIIFRDGPFNEGDEIAEGRPKPGPEPKFKEHFALQVTFEQGIPAAGQPVWATLVDLHNSVRDDILPRFLARL